MRALALMLTFGSCLMASSTALADTIAPQKAESGTIVVTAIRLEATAAKLKACIAQHCPPIDDIAASLAHAENQFVAGDYRGARSTLLAARGRDRRYAAQYPVAVAGLLRANARIAAHLGEKDAFQLGTIDTLSALKSGLPEQDPQILGARIELGDMWRRLGDSGEAARIYRSVISQARDAGEINVQGLAMLRLATLLDALESAPGKISRGAQQLINEMTSNKDPRYQVFAQAAKLLVIRLALRDGDPGADSALNSLLKEVAPTETPVLVYGPSLSDRITYSRSAIRSALGGSGARSSVPTRTEFNNLSTEEFDNQWIDISFYVAPDGHVEDAQILRQSAKLSDSIGWVPAIVDIVAARRYLPLKLDPSDPGVLRVERYTRASFYEYSTGSRLRQRSADGYIEMTDLSIDKRIASSSR